MHLCLVQNKMSLDDIPTNILHVLEDLESSNFEKFLFKLTDRSEKPCVRASEVEKKSCVEVTKLLVSRCTEPGAVDRTIRTLRDIGCNNEAQELELWNKRRLDKDRPALCYTSTGLLELTPTPEAQAVAKNCQILGNIPLNVPVTQDDVPKDDPLALGRSILTFGRYKGQSFKWLLENEMQYTVYIVGLYLRDQKDGKTLDPSLMKNQGALTKYVALFPDVATEAQFYCDGLAPGLNKYKEITLMEVYDSQDKDKKSFVQWLRGQRSSCDKGTRKEAAINYILHRDKRRSIIHHQPGTTSHQPGTTSPQPGTADHQPVTIDHQPGTIDHQPGATDHQPVTTYHQPGSSYQEHATPFYQRGTPFYRRGTTTRFSTRPKRSFTQRSSTRGKRFMSAKTRQR